MSTSDMVRLALVNTNGDEIPGTEVYVPRQGFGLTTVSFGPADKEWTITHVFVDGRLIEVTDGSEAQVLREGLASRVGPREESLDD